MSTTVPPPAPRPPCEELPRVFLSACLTVPFSGPGQTHPDALARPSKRPPSPSRKTHRLVRPFENVVTRPPRIQLLGLLPAILKPCGPACAQPFTNRNVEALRDEEWHETPAFVLENADRAHRIAEDLFRDFGDRVRIEVVGLDSPRGVWLRPPPPAGQRGAGFLGGPAVFLDPPPHHPGQGGLSRALSTPPLSAGPL